MPADGGPGFARHSERALRGIDLFTPDVVDRLLAHFTSLGPLAENEPGIEASREEIAATIRQFARALSFSLDVPGSHYGGISNNDLLDVLDSQGRRFAANSRQLKDHVRDALMTEFVDGGEVPSEERMRGIAADAILEWIVMRFNGAARDVPMRSLSPAYAAWKRKQGYSSRIGIATGDLLAAIQDQGQVTVS